MYSKLGPTDEKYYEKIEYQNGFCFHLVLLGNL